MPATPAESADPFTLTISINPNTNPANCPNHILVKTTTTTAKDAYAGVTMSIPVYGYVHSDGSTDAICPVTFTYFVSADNGSTWVSTGTTYTQLVNAATNGALTLKPDLATFGSSSATRKVKVICSLNATGKSIEDIFDVTIHTTAELA